MQRPGASERHAQFSNGPRGTKLGKLFHNAPPMENTKDRGPLDLVLSPVWRDVAQLLLLPPATSDSCKGVVPESTFTNAVHKPSHFRHEPSPRLQHFPGTHQNPHGIRFTPVYRCVAKHRVELFLDTRSIGRKLQRLDICYKGMLEAVGFGLGNLLGSIVECGDHRIFPPTMLSLKSTPTTNPPSPCSATPFSSRAISPLPHPKSMIRSPGCAASRSKTGDVNAGEYTNGAFWLYTEADHPDESRESELFCRCAISAAMMSVATWVPLLVNIWLDEVGRQFRQPEFMVYQAIADLINE